MYKQYKPVQIKSNFTLLYIKIQLAWNHDDDYDSTCVPLYSQPDATKLSGRQRGLRNDD